MAIGAPRPLLRRALLLTTALCGVAFAVDAAWAATFTITNTNDSGAGSLRQAIIDSNATPGSNTIAIQAGLNGIVTLASDLPPIVVPASIKLVNTAGVDGIGIAGNFGLSVATAGAVTFSNLIGTYSGNTTITSGTVNLGGLVAGDTAVAEPSLLVMNPGTTVNIGISGSGATFGNLSGTGTIVNNSPSTSSFALSGGDGTPRTFAGTISGTGALVMLGGGENLTLSGATTYSGGTFLEAGAGGPAFTLVLQAGAANVLSPNSRFTMQGNATLKLNGFNQTIASLDSFRSVLFPGALPTIDLGAGRLTTGGDNLNGTYFGSIVGTGGLTKTGSGVLTLQTAAGSFNSTINYSGATLLTAGILQAANANAFSANSAHTVNAGATLDLNNFDQTIGSLAGAGNVTFGSGRLTVGSDNSSTSFSGVMSGTGGLTKTGSGVFTVSGVNTYTGSTNISAGTLRTAVANAFAPAGAFTVATGALFDLNDFNQRFGSLAGSGGVTLGAAALTTGGNNTSTTFSGAIAGTGGLTKEGTGTFNLTGTNSYTGATIVNAGALVVDGSIATSALTTVNPGGTLAGSGTVGNTAIAGGTLAPGSVGGSLFGPLTVQGSLSFTAASTYLIQVSPTNAGLTNVTGTATLGGATVSTMFQPGSYINKRYTIVNATGGVSGTFNPTVVSNMAANIQSTLSYDAKDAFLNIKLLFAVPPSGSLNVNQQNVANALTGYFNSNGGIPFAFATLNAAGLTIASGELPTASQQTTFDAMNLFLGLLTDPFVAGRGNNSASSPGAASRYTAEDDASAYAATGRKRTGLEHDAYAMFTKAPLAQNYNPRWSVWAAGYGGSQTTDGNAALGSNTATSRVFGTAVGADYLLSPRTILGFALAGGGTNFSVANGLGSGRSDLFQAGAFARHTAGPAYVSGALAYGWQDITTDRTVTLAGIDQLRARLNANTWSGRVEGGYRFVAPWIGGVGLTPYVAGQFTTLDLPAYAEQVLTGANTFALAYGSKSVTDTRSELGIWADKSFAVQNAILTLRGRAAWAHDYNPDRNIGATFQTLPGASFVVNGARQANDSALTTASAEMKWLNGWSTAATFEGAFSNVTTSYAGKGVVRYAW